mgnify:CR=1 FL=1
MSEDAARMNKAAVQAMAAGDMRGAHAVLMEALKRDRANLRLWLNLAVVRRQLHDRERKLDKAEDASQSRLEQLQKQEKMVESNQRRLAEKLDDVLYNAGVCYAEGGSVTRTGGVVKFASVQTVEKIPRAITVTSKGVAGHGSVPLETNALAHLGEAVGKIAAWTPPMRIKSGM